VDAEIRDFCFSVYRQVQGRQQAVTGKGGEDDEEGTPTICHRKYEGAAKFPELLDHE